MSVLSGILGRSSLGAFPLGRAPVNTVIPNAQATCPYIPFHVTYDGFFADAMPPVVADYRASLPASAAPVYDQNVAIFNLDQEIQVVYPATDVLPVFRQPLTSIPLTQASGTDQVPINIFVSPAPIPIAAYGSVVTQSQEQAPTTPSLPGRDIPAADVIPPRRVECR